MASDGCERSGGRRGLQAIAEDSSELVSLIALDCNPHCPTNWSPHQAISEDWSDEQLSFGDFKARGQITLQPGATGELMEKVEETLMALGSMLASRYVAPFREGVQGWVAKLSAVSDVLEVWMQVQGMWIYLEAVFTSGDIAKQLPQESKRFLGIDKSWEKIMVKALETRNVVQYIYGNEGLQELLPHLLEQLELCQKALSGYLDQKRAAFPRFYFVSDPSLLEILSQVC